jgi:hypothetical protein
MALACALWALGAAGPGRADLSYTVTIRIQEESQAEETVVQRCRLKGSRLLCISEYPGENLQVEQLMDFEKAALYTLDRKAKKATVTPLPEPEAVDVEYEARPIGDRNLGGRSCKGFAIEERQDGQTISTMEVYATEEIQADFGALWRSIVPGQSKSLNKLRDQVKGFPMLFKRTSEKDPKAMFSMEVDEVKEGDLPAEDFSIPEGFLIETEPASSDSGLERL